MKWTQNDTGSPFVNCDERESVVEAAKDYDGGVNNGY